MKAVIIAFSTAALVAAAPAVFAQDASHKRAPHSASKKLHPAVSGYASRREMQAKVSTGRPAAFGPMLPGVPMEPNPNAGGGGGGGGGM